MAELRLENVSKTFAGKPPIEALRSFSITVREGECVALLGESGAGKSTVLRLIGGLESPTAGDVLLGGKSLLGATPAERNVSMVFQQPALLPQLSAGENLRLGGKLRKLPDLEDRARRIAALLGVEGLSGRKPSTLSGGEQQRIALGRALISSPRVLLLDEPLASLDPLARGELRETIRRVQRELKLTTLYVTHDQAEAAAADRIALLARGEVLQCGTARELYVDPRDLFVARFFGPDGLNVLAATVSFRDGKRIVEAEGTQIGLSGAPNCSGEMTLAFRPSGVRIGRAADGPWTVRNVQDLGWATVVRLVAGRSEVRAQIPGGMEFSEGERVSVEVDPARTYWFDAGTGKRVA